MSDPKRYRNWAKLLKRYGCRQLARGLRQEGKRIGPQCAPSGSLNSYHLDNPYVRAIGALVDSGLKGAKEDKVRRTVDVFLRKAGLKIDQRERDVLAHLLRKGKI